MIQRWVIGAAAASILMSASSTFAGQTSAQLGYTIGAGATDCPTRASLHRAVSSRLGYDPFDQGAASTVTVVLGGEGSRLGAVVEVSLAGQPGGRRVVEGVRGCHELIEVVALVISLTLDPEAVKRTKTARRARERERRMGRNNLSLLRPEQRKPAPSARLEPEGQDGTALPLYASPMHWDVTALGALWLGLSPTVSAGGGLEFGLQWPFARMSVALFGAGSPPARLSGRRIAPSLGELVVSGCGTYESFEGCVGWFATRVEHDANTPELESSSVEAWLTGPTLKVGAVIPISASVTFDCGARLMVPLQGLVIAQAGQVLWSAAPVMGVLRLGLRWQQGTHER